MRARDEAFEYLTELKQVLQFVEVSTCDMEKGHLRCDANVSVRPRGQEKFGTKAEVKNLNSFRFLKQAIDFEIARQVGLIEAGGRVIAGDAALQSGRGRDVRHAQQGRGARLPLLPRAGPGAAGHQRRVAGACAVDDAGDCLPTERRRFIEEYGLREYDAQVLTGTRAMAEYYEAVGEGLGRRRSWRRTG